MMTTRPPSMKCYGRLTDGTEWEQLHVAVPSRIAWETTASKRKWSSDTHAMTLSVFVAWHASKRAGLHDLGFDQFVEQALDAGLHNDTDDDAEADEDDVDDLPTEATESRTTA